MLQHWHPLCAVRSVRSGPVAVQIAGQDVVVFRTKTGAIGVLNDSCPHRRMKLSCGTVRNECIVCPYHGWSFDRHGTGESPGTPKLRTQASVFEVTEWQGYVWARLPDATTEFPFQEPPDFVAVRPLEQVINAPLELVLDNFTEVEDAATVHKYVGYALGDMPQVRSVVSCSPERVEVENTGPQKSLPRMVRLLFGIPQDSEFHWEWSTRFSPVHTTYTEYWSHPKTGCRVGVSARIHVFFCPIDDRSTRLVVFPAFRLPYRPAISRICLAFREIARQMVRYEIRQDAQMVNQLADTRTDILGMKLSRFDRTLSLHRERIARIYRAQAHGTACDGQADVISRSADHELRRV